MGSINSTSLFIHSRTSTSVAKVYRSGIQIGGGSVPQGSSSLPSGNVFISSTNDSVAKHFSNRESAFASIGDGLTDTEAANFYTAVQTFQTTLGRHVGVPIVADTDAQAFLDAAVITDQTQASAINTLVTDLKSANIWTKMKAIYPFVGGTASAHKFNLKDPRDLDAAYRLVFNGGWTHSSTGALPNGSNGNADTRLNTKNVLTPNNLSIGLYTNTNRVADTSPSRIAYGNSDNTTTYVPLTQFYLRSGNNTLISDLGDGNYGRISVTNTTTAGFYVNTRTSTTSNKTFKSGVLFGSSTQNNLTNTLPNSNIFIACFNDGNVRGSYEIINYQFFYTSDGLSDAEAAAFYNAVQAYQTTLGRQV